MNFPKVPKSFKSFKFVGPVLLVVFVVLAFFFGFIPTAFTWYDLVLENRRGGDVVFYVRIADTDEDRRRGLQNVDHLGERKGMWFVFEDEAVRNFWMKNTKIPLDVIFFDKDKKVVGLVKNMQPCPEAETQCPRYSSEVPAMYALEAQSGFAENNAVQIGDVITES